MESDTMTAGSQIYSSQRRSEERKNRPSKCEKVSKMFVVIMQNPAKESILTLKLEPGYGQLLRLNHKEITPGYHFNKRHWNSVSLESNVSDELIEELIDESYNIVFKSLSKKAQSEVLDEMQS
jgi:predicted DNA-binding protein (MmcQ/YjbR family)